MSLEQKKNKNNNDTVKIRNKVGQPNNAVHKKEYCNRINLQRRNQKTTTIIIFNYSLNNK